MMQSLEEVYWQTAKMIPSERPVSLLDLGCCTELEYDAFIRINADIEVTGIEEEEHLNELLKRKTGKRIERLRLIYGDYFEVDFGKRHYDMAMAMMEMNQFDRKKKLLLYSKIYAALASNGSYVERDYVVDEHCVLGNVNNLFSNQVSLLLEAGFQRVERVWHNGNTILIKAIK